MSLILLLDKAETQPGPPPVPPDPIDPDAFINDLAFTNDFTNAGVAGSGTHDIPRAVIAFDAPPSGKVQITFNAPVVLVDTTSDVNNRNVIYHLTDLDNTSFGLAIATYKVPEGLFLRRALRLTWRLSGLSGPQAFKIRADRAASTTVTLQAPHLTAPAPHWLQVEELIDDA